MNYDEMSREELLDLLDKAKEHYYNTGEELISDADFDEIEHLCGLDNKNYIGSAKGNYDVKHSFIMGSLSKTQVKADREGEVNWDKCANEIDSALCKANDIDYYETSPKLDGCSFSIEFKNKNGKAYLFSVSTRGNGEWGSDIKHWFLPNYKTDYWSKIDEATNALCKMNSDDIFSIRGEVLVKQSDFSSKYVNSYVNPRAFAAGMLGIKYEDATEDKLAQGKDLHFVCYDYRVFSNGKYRELSWMNPYDPSYRELKPYLNHIGELPDPDYCQVHKYNGKFTADDLKAIYDDYDEFRKKHSEYALDGVVFKPSVSSRRYNFNRPRPVDCIAMKFLPMLNITEIVDYDWKVGKTGEYFPTAILKTFVMEDGKNISKASAHNYSWIINNNCGIGSKVRISLAGDIIPFIYEIIEHKDADDNMSLPSDTYVKQDPNSKSLHLMKKFSKDEEVKNRFLSSAETLNINTIGPAAAELLYDNLHEEFDELDNIIYLMNDESYDLIYKILGKSKSIMNYVENLKKYSDTITLADIIRSFNFRYCGKKASEVCAKIIAGKKYDTTSLPAESYSWALNTNSREYYLVNNAMEILNVDIDYSDEDEEENENAIPVILTGSPSNFGYPTKNAFLQAHPDLRETTSWKEIQILVTDDLGSTSGKMKKAQKAGIPIKTYGDFDDNRTNEDFDFNQSLF